MLLAPNGLDVWYVDESGDEDIFVVTAISVPFLRPQEQSFAFHWNNYLTAVREYRRELSRTHLIPPSKELHATKLVSGRGCYRKDEQRLSRPAAAAVYRWMLSKLSFLPNKSIITVIVPSTKVAGLERKQVEGRRRELWEFGLVELFKRMERASKATQTNGMTFFDGIQVGYLKAYRKARVFLPTASAYGGWKGSGNYKNIPMESFVKDANFKDSKLSHFVQLADLIAYAGFLKARERYNKLTSWQVKLGLQDAYDHIPRDALNTHASREDPQGLVWVAPK